MSSLYPQSIPGQLKALEQWVLWRRETRKGGKPTKVPYSAHGGMGKSNDPSTWASFERALDTYQRGDYDGLGFVFCKGDGLTGVDLDHCTGYGGPNEAAAEILKHFADCAYIERSPSGEGLRLITLGTPHRCGKGTDEKWVELYDHSSPRYLTITGDVMADLPGQIGEGQAALDWLHEKYFLPREKPRAAAPLPPSQPIDLDDRELLDIARRSRNGSDFVALYDRGDLGAHGGDHSSADLALCNSLAFWFNRDASRMDRAFRSSALMRPKWDRNAGGGRTYGDRTIDRAITDCGEVFEGRRSNGAQPPPPDDPMSPPPEDGGASDWRDALLWKHDKDGERIGLRREGLNAARILSHDRRWGGVLAYDAAAQMPVFTKAPPFPQDYGGTDRDYPCGLQDDDYLRISYWLAERWALSLNTEPIAGAVLVAAKHHQRHPLQDYLNGLSWDGTERLATWLRSYLGAQPFGQQSDRYLSLVGRWWMISAVARAYSPGCKADHVLVLEGAEGLGKSRCLAILGGEGYADTQVSIGDKDAYLHIRGKWIVELAELDSLMRTESSASKAFFSSSVDRYRAPYARTMAEVPRTCVFAGTVNHSDYIRDASGGRRYWPVLCTAIDQQRLIEDRDQLWAEAVDLFKKKVGWWPTDNEQRALLREEQEARQVDDPWEELIQNWLLGKAEVTPAQILSDAIGLSVEKQDRRAQTRVGMMMQRIGWIRHRDRRGYAAKGRLSTYYTVRDENV